MWDCTTCCYAPVYYVLLCCCIFSIWRSWALVGVCNFVAWIGASLEVNCFPCFKGLFLKLHLRLSWSIPAHLILMLPYLGHGIVAKRLCFIWVATIWSELSGAVYLGSRSTSCFEKLPGCSNRATLNHQPWIYEKSVLIMVLSVPCWFF